MATRKTTTRKTVAAPQARIFRNAWLWEQFEDRGDYFRKRMFGCQAVYLSGRLMFAVAEKEEPWCGLLCATSREHHPSLLAQFPFLSPHAVLGKWLYLSSAEEGFEERAQQLMDAVARGDQRLGVDASDVRKRKSPASVNPLRERRT